MASERDLDLSHFVTGMQENCQSNEIKDKTTLPQRSYSPKSKLYNAYSDRVPIALEYYSWAGNVKVWMGRMISPFCSL